MKKLLKVVVSLWIGATACGCGTAQLNTINSNTSLTNVELSQANYRIVKNIEGFSSASYVLGIGGLSRKAIRDNAVADMMRKAKLTGSQAIVNVHVKKHVATVLGLYTEVSVTATAQVIEFLSENDNDRFQQTQDQQKAVNQQKLQLGDLYDDGVCKGYIFEISDDGAHGKIVYPKQIAVTSWCTKELRNELPQTTDTEDGENNMRVIRAIPDWQTNYPAFAACAELGPNWYLPTSKELKSISNLDKIAFLYDLKYTDAWSSTVSKSKARYAQTLLWSNISVTNKIAVIAVSKF